ncbi:ferritin-like domain-containing protein [Streptomyces sp. NPDC059578]|uniref:ferritin-like domain-containing protein n=1 Tax=Streptomyces sp. NPDC059578 TaxID=3346874 RepID=UPI0036B46CF7
MSVFDLPRLHFAGTATTRLPTGLRCGLVDLATHRVHDDDGPVPPDRPTTEYRDFLRRRGPRHTAAGRPDPDGGFSAAEGWDFGGNGHFWMDARVVGVETTPLDQGPSGTRAAVERDDPVVGTHVDVWGHYNPYLQTTVNRARIFDLDPASRWTAALMVGRFGVGRRGRSHDDGYLLTGGVEGYAPPRWVGFQHVRDVGDDPLAHLAPELGYSAVHQFTVAYDALDWLPGADASAAVAALRGAPGEADGLVVQLALDCALPPRSPGTFPTWRVRGTIAPWHAHEPRTHPAGRQLVPVPAGPLRHLAAEVALGRAALNLVTAVPLASRTEHRDGPRRPGPPVDLGDLELRTAVTGRFVARFPADTYLRDTTHGIVSVPAAPDWRAAQDEALHLVRVTERGTEVLLVERETTVHVDDPFLVLHHRDRARQRDHQVAVPLRTYHRGRPAGATVHVAQYHNPRALPGDPVAGSPRARCGDAVLLGTRGTDDYGPGCTVTTGPDGRGHLTLRGERAGTCRVLLTTRPDDAPPTDLTAPGSAWTAYDDEDALDYWAGADHLAVRVLPDDWHLDEIPREQVDFALLHREVLALYEHVSSFMRTEVFSLSDRCKVETYAQLAWQMCDPANRSKTYYMPPTRDLSDPKARLFLAFLRNQQSRVTPPRAAPARLPTEPAITTRSALRTALTQAAALELSVMLQYLYAAYSVPTHGAGLALVRRGDWTERQLALACGSGGEGLHDGVRGTLLNVAREEMIHFLLVNNIIMAIGEPFQVPVIDFTTIGAELPIRLDFALEPLNLGSVQRFIAIEQPSALTPRLTPAAAATPPDRFTWGSISELYAGIREGLTRVPDLFLVDQGRGGGEHHLFLRESVNTVHPDYQLEVDDLTSALFAIDIITEQGEGAVEDGRASAAEQSGEPSHFEAFLRIEDALTSERVPGPLGRPVPWNPAYPVLRNPSLRPGDGIRTEITDPTARSVATLFNRSYHLALQLMAQHFAQSPDASLRRSKLMNASIDVMTGMMRPLGELLVTLDSGRHGRTAGPTFELDAPPVAPPRPDVAHRALALRFAHLAAAARTCPPVPDKVPELMEFYADFFRRLGTG